MRLHRGLLFGALAFAGLSLRPTVALAQHRALSSDSPCGDEDDDKGRGGSADVTVAAKPNGTVDVYQFGGSVHVTTWAQSSVHVKGDFSPRCHIDVTPSGDRQVVRLACSRGPGTGDLELQVPQGSSVDLRSLSADVTVQGVNGAVHVETVSGDVELTDGSPSEIDVRSTSGDVKIAASSPQTRAHSVSGDLHVTGVRGRASLRTVSGECVLSGGEFESVEVHSISGDVVFTGGVTRQGTFEVQTHSGDQALHLPPTTGADVEMATTNGDLVIDMGSGRKTGEGALTARIGAGGARLRLRSFSGDIKVTQ